MSQGFKSPAVNATGTRSQLRHRIWLIAKRYGVGKLKIALSPNPKVHKPAKKLDNP